MPLQGESPANFIPVIRLLRPDDYSATNRFSFRKLMDARKATATLAPSCSKDKKNHFCLRAMMGHCHDQHPPCKMIHLALGPGGYATDFPKADLQCIVDFNQEFDGTIAPTADQLAAVHNARP